MIETYEWLLLRNKDKVPRKHGNRILGLLLGYSPDAIAAFDEWGSGRRFKFPEEIEKGKDT